MKHEASNERECQPGGEHGCLLGVDVGLRTGLALYGADGRLQWCRSHHFARVGSLKRRAYALLRELPLLSWLILEGGGPAADVWIHEAGKRGVEIVQIQAQDWRPVLLYTREQRSGEQAKARATELARRIIAWSGAPKPASLRHDAAEAVCVGLWGALHVGLIDAMPSELGR